MSTLSNSYWHREVLSSESIPVASSARFQHYGGGNQGLSHGCSRPRVLRACHQIVKSSPMVSPLASYTGTTHSASHPLLWANELCLCQHVISTRIMCAEISIMQIKIFKCFHVTRRLKFVFLHNFEEYLHEQIGCNTRLSHKAIFNRFSYAWIHTIKNWHITRQPSYIMYNVQTHTPGRYCRQLRQ